MELIYYQNGDYLIPDLKYIEQSKENENEQFLTNDKRLF